jgi:hypothetical protein
VLRAAVEAVGLSTVKLTAVATAFSRGGDTPTTVDPAGRGLDCRPRGRQTDVFAWFSNVPRHDATKPRPN